LARTHTVTAINTLVEIANQCSDPRARVRAAEIILDRGYGKVREQVTVGIDQVNNGASVIGVLTPDEIQALARRGLAD
jgi:hypothetical protein